MRNGCPKCQVELTKETRGNVSFKRNGIEITLADAKYRACNACGIAVLPEDVKSLVERTIEEKKRFGGSPSLYIHVSELIGSK